MNSEEIFVVRGSAGEYSDRTEWPVAAYTTEEQAQDCVVKAEMRANEIFSILRMEGFSEKENEFDPEMPKNYGEARYRYEKVALIRN